MLSLVGQLSPGRFRILRNAGWLSIEQVFRLGVGLLVTVWVARYLGPAQFGTYTYVLAFVALFGPIARMELDSLVVRDIAREPESRAEVLGTSFVLKLLGGGVSVLSAVTIAAGLHGGDRQTCSLVACIVLIYVLQPFDAIQLWFASQLQAKIAVVAKTSAYLVVAALKVLLIVRGAPLMALALATLLEAGLTAGCLLVGYQHAGEDVRRWRFSFQRAKAMAKESWPLILSGLTFLVYCKIDQVMLGALAASSEVAFYSVAVKLAEVTGFVPMILQATFLPRLSELFATSREAYERLLQVYFDLMLASWLAIALFVTVVSVPLVSALYGASYAPSAGLLSVYIWGQFGTSLGIARSTFLTVEGKVHLNLVLQIAGALFNTLLNAVAIPRYGAMGAAVASLLTYLLVTVAMNAVVPQLAPVGRLIGRACHLPAAVRRIAVGMR